MSRNLRRRIPALLAFLCALMPALGQGLAPAQVWGVTAFDKYAISPDITYGVFNNHALKLDVWQFKDSKTPRPTLIYFHGGGWIFGDRTGCPPQKPLPTAICIRIGANSSCLLPAKEFSIQSFCPVRS